MTSRFWFSALIDWLAEMETYPILVVLLVTVGLAALVGELMIPSAGILTVVALGCLGGSAWCAWQAWYAKGNLVAWWSYVGAVLFLMPTAISATLYILPRTSFGQELFAAPQSAEELTPFQDEGQKLHSLINQHGHTQNLFSPGGMVQIGRDRFHAESEGMMIDPDTEVVVVGVKGNRLVVCPLSLYEDSRSTAAAATEPPAFDAENADSDDPSGHGRSIDFDVPETA